MAQFYDIHQHDALKYNVSDKVWLSLENIRTTHCIVVLWHAQGVWEAIGGYIGVGECVEFD